MCDFLRNVQICFSRHELLQHAKHWVYYSRTQLIRMQIVRIANCPILVGISVKFFANYTQLPCLEITGSRIKYCTLVWLLERYKWHCRNILTQVLTINSNRRNSICQMKNIYKRISIIRLFCISGSFAVQLNTFAASYLNTQGLNNSCLKSPASTLVDLTFQSLALRSFSLNQLRNLSL